MALPAQRPKRHQICFCLRGRGGGSAQDTGFPVNTPPRIVTETERVEFQHSVESWVAETRFI